MEVSIFTEKYINKKAFHLVEFIRILGPSEFDSFEREANLSYKNFLLNEYEPNEIHLKFYYHPTYFNGGRDNPSQHSDISFFYEITNKHIKSFHTVHLDIERQKEFSINNKKHDNEFIELQNQLKEKTHILLSRFKRESSYNDSPKISSIDISKNCNSFELLKIQLTKVNYLIEKVFPKELGLWEKIFK